MRALSFARIASRHHPITIITNCPHLPLIQHSLSWQREVKEFDLQLQFISIPSNATINHVRHEMPGIIRDIAPEILFVDTFPRGIIGDLALVLPKLQQCQRILIHRDISPNYLSSFDIEEFVLRHYSQIVSVEKDTPLRHIGRTVGPWVMRRREELGAGDEEAGIVISVSGKSKEQELFESIALGICHVTDRVSILSAKRPKVKHKHIRWIKHFPGIEIINRAEIVIGSGGYNTVYESQTTKKNLISITFCRLYDQQERRCLRNRVNYFRADETLITERIISLLERIRGKEDTEEKVSLGNID